MRIHRINLALRLTAATLLAAVPVVVGVGVWIPTDAAGVAPPEATAAARPGPRAAATTAPATLLTAAVDRPLRPDLDAVAGAAAEPPAGPVATGATPQRVRLVGTIGNSIAMVKGPDDSVALVEVGDDLEGADVVAIGEQVLELRQNGRVFRLEKATPKPEGGDGPVR